jgi:uncharacterized protein YutE (UPF0331/DUF86 family)
MNEHELTEQSILDQYEPSWVAQGYQVIRQPQRANLPEFLSRYVPDAVLLGRNPNVVVEVIRKGNPHAERKIRDLKALFNDHDDWRLEVLYAGEVAQTLPTMSIDALKEGLASVRRLTKDEPKSALLIAWATLEALARGLEPEKTMRPQSPGRIVELLAGAGYIAPSEAEIIRQAVQLRNRLVHGDLAVQPSTTQMLSIATAVEDLIHVLERRNEAKTS